ncbi:hypothetical protein BKA66DRAFT_297052 [Pyrenochaeta sp. MPI-SDFR-AT-0127]|nr:hypothetical protein BKA66DRAFT_297052 [Pyrenochaeta sp. MPI-SDFR-AT-0127]
MVHHPEVYLLASNEFAPNSKLPVLIYRNCLPRPFSEDETTAFLESHGWVKKGSWGHIPIRHFHPNTHECYGVFQGSSTLLIGQGHNDTSGGQEIELTAGDVIVLPAGTAHCNIRSTKNYKYIGVYPEGAPRWRNELGKQKVDHEAFGKEIRAVAMPAQDPVNGANGPLLRLWETSQISSKL